MIRIRTFALLLVTACMNFAAHGEIIRVTFATSLTLSSTGNPATVKVVMEFDTTTPPAPGPSGTLLFYPTGAAIRTLGTPASDSPFFDETNLGTLNFARLQYFPGSNTIALEANDGVDFGTLSISNMPAAFHPAMDSLPNDAADWAPDLATSIYHGNTSLSFGQQISWFPGAGFLSGTITYSAHELSAPSNACSPADFNGDGVLNFFDVSAFISTFGAGCP